MVVTSHASARARIQQLLRISAEYFAIPSHPDRPAPIRFLIASEFKDPIPLRWCSPARRISRAHPTPSVL